MGTYTAAQEIILSLFREEKGTSINPENVDCKELYWHLVNHKVNCLFGSVKDKYKEIIESDRVLSYQLNNDYQNNRIRCDILGTQVLPQIADILEKNTISFVFLKGNSTCFGLYEKLGARRFRDIDILVEKNDVRLVKKVLSEAGIKPEQEDDYNVKSAYFEMVTHQTYPFIAKNEYLADGGIEIDINFGYGPEAVLKNPKIVSEALQRKTAVIYKGNVIPCLSHEDEVIFLCIHIWRDAVYLHRIKNNSDIRLYQYYELVELIRKYELDWDFIHDFTKKYNLSDYVYYALYHTLMICPELKEKVSAFMNRTGISRVDFLDEFGAENKTPGKWPIPFSERIFNNKKFDAIAERYDMSSFEAFNSRQKILD